MTNFPNLIDDSTSQDSPERGFLFGLSQGENHDDRNYANLTVCDRWLTFANFLEDMGERPEGMSIERKDNSVGYTPSNCVWADRTTQSCNRRNARLYEYGGQVKNLSTWCQELNLNYAKVYARLKRGATFVEAIT